MKSNKEYRKDPNIESAMCSFSDIVDLCDECKDNLRYISNLTDVKNNIQKIKSIINDIEKSLEKY